MAIDSVKISQFCNVAELTFVEVGIKDGQAGFWFSPRDYSRVFYTEDHILARLDRRRNTLFETKRVTKS